MIPLAHYLVLGAVLFALSIIGIFLNRKNLLIILMSIELLLLAGYMNFIAFSAFSFFIGPSWHLSFLSLHFYMVNNQFFQFKIKFS
jgi:NADH:ubiquinone oxidoreductase subunit K